MNKTVSLIIPAHNENKRISATLEHIHKYLSGAYPDFEIIVVDDGSTDKTSDVVTALISGMKNVTLLRNDVNRGKGYSVKRGVLASTGKIICFSDADESVPIDELPKFLSLIKEGADIAIASRALKDSMIIKRQAIWRQTMGKIFNIFVRILAFGGIRDTQCGFKCFGRRAALDLFQRQIISGFAFDVEILYLAKKRGYAIREIPVRWINSPESKVKPLYDSMVMLRDIVFVKFLHLWDP